MLLSIKKACDPDFYNFVRPWLGGGTWVFEGEETDTDTLVGSSAAQSPLIQTLDAFLGTSDRTTKSKDLLSSMRTYMSRSHREFLEQLQNGGWDDKDAHIVIVTLFVVGPARRAEKARIKGTAGTGLMVFLKDVRDSTKV
ncbi:indoleamine 2,3-dioxyganese b [Moniliophthora roreri MCA 2997]|uniref:Indoleamine 2,3-dioxyganese b n=1 Tax=Moniliophthora roreri (strain MCA 2997) TaxID=1381753 RepID=V2WE97_MONRO|nr:indoleamine 2,3-dioxyganese b [Moniliophthora roreri MCA 2997]